MAIRNCPVPNVTRDLKRLSYIQRRGIAKTP